MSDTPSYGAKHTDPERPCIGEEPPTATILKLCADATRRELLRYLARNPTHTVSVEEISEHLRCVDAAADADRLAIRLRHVHLPKLENAGLIARTVDDAVQYCGSQDLARRLDALEAE